MSEQKYTLISEGISKSNNILRSFPHSAITYPQGRCFLPYLKLEDSTRPGNLKESSIFRQPSRKSVNIQKEDAADSTGKKKHKTPLSIIFKLWARLQAPYRWSSETSIQRYPG